VTLNNRIPTILALTVLVGALLTACSDDGFNITPPTEDRAFYILPPGNYGGVPTGANSLDQLPLYDGLTPLRGNVTDADIEALFLPEDFQPVGETVEEVTGRQGLTILYDSFGVPHITGDTRADLAFGAGWVTVRDRSLLIDFGRYTSRVAVADVPGINAFSLVTSAQVFEPSAATEQLVTDQQALILEVYGEEEGQQILDDAAAYAEGMNAYEAANGIEREEPYNVNDVIAVTAFIGSIFGAGGGNEVRNAEFLSTLRNSLGSDGAQLAWEDAMLFDDPEAPTTINERFDYGPLTGGDVTGTLPIDEGSVIDLDPRQPAPTVTATAVLGKGDVLVPATDKPPGLQASNFLVVDSDASASAATLAVMGPQLGYYYPEIVQQIHLSGAGIEAQGVGVPGLSMYLLIGRTLDYAWSLTSANHDVRDVFIEVLCEPNDSEPTRDSMHYEYNGECVEFEIFNAGLLNGVPLVYPQSVHGNMIGTATSNGQPVALTRKRSTFGRDGLNLGALKAMTEGRASTPELFWETANRFGFTFNWAYASRSNIAYFSSGYLPVRSEGLDRRLPTLGTGDYEWQGFLTQEEHPHSVGGPNGKLLNWNNQSAPGFMHGDGTPYGSVHRVQLFDQFPNRVDLAGVVGIMNRSATEDTRTPAWPAISEVLRGSDAPSELSAAVVDLLDEWVADDAPQLDADEDGFNDHAGPTIFRELWKPLATEVMRPVFGDSVTALDRVRSLSGNSGSSYMDKDLRTLLGQEVDGPFNLQYCGAGDLSDCRSSLWAVVDSVSTTLADRYGSDDPSSWLRAGQRQGFLPGLIEDDFRATNRPTFQQVLEFAPTRPADL
jgi:acyl-homoserine lactone acylase PvdQ